MCVTVVITPPPPLELVQILKTYCKVFVTGTDHPPPWNVDDVTQAMSKGGGVLVNVQEWGCFSIFRRVDDVTRTMSKSGGVFQFFGGWMTSRGQCPRVGVFFNFLEGG